jgi:hypothetical protein
VLRRSAGPRVVVDQSKRQKKNVKALVFTTRCFNFERECFVCSIYRHCQEWYHDEVVPEPQGGGSRSSCRIRSSLDDGALFWQTKPAENEWILIKIEMLTGGKLSSLYMPWKYRHLKHADNESIHAQWSAIKIHNFCNTTILELARYHPHVPLFAR